MALRSFRLSAAAALVAGTTAAPAGASFAGVALDSRAVRPGNLFVALKGERADGHDYVAEAAARGAAALLMERPLAGEAPAPVLRVASTELALRALGCAARGAFGGTVVGVVGSCGKTSTKDFTAAVLARGGATSATAGNRNNLLGVPETLLNADADARFWAIELGISRPGEMEELAPVALPDGVVFTNIQPVHTEFFPSLDAIRDEKAKVLRWTRPDGFAAVNADDPLLTAVPVPAGMRRLTYGRAAEADLRIETGARVSEAGVPFALHWAGARVRGFLPLPGDHQAMNFAAACAAGLACGLSLDEVAAAGPSLKPARHRGELVALKDGILVLDDSYNANPAAVAAVLKSASRWGRRVVAVLGEMRELGPEAATHHARAGREAAKVAAALAVVGGEPARPMAEAFGESGRPVFYAAEWQEARGWIESHLAPGDLLLVKGSRAVGLDGLVDALAARGGS